MVEKKSSKRKADPVRIRILRMLPYEIKKSLTSEEIDAVLYEDIWPDSLHEKLKDYIMED
jgi:hypothetical protein